MPLNKIKLNLARATVGVVTPIRSNILNTIPHKLFQYLIAGLPVLVSDSPPLEMWSKLVNVGGLLIQKIRVLWRLQ